MEIAKKLKRDHRTFKKEIANIGKIRTRKQELVLRMSQIEIGKK